MVGKGDISAGRRGQIAIVGAGLIGLSCAFELFQRGYTVTVFDPAPAEASASWAAAGMIAPAYEVMLHGGAADSPLANLCFESASLWRGLAARLREATGLPVGYSQTETLALARDSEEASRLAALEERLRRSWRGAQWIESSDLRAALGLSASVRAALSLPDDHQVDNRHALKALRSLSGQRGFQLVRTRITSREDVQASLGSERVDAIIWARGIHETGVDLAVKGQALSLQGLTNIPDRVLRFGSGYIVPKPDRIVVGATSEETYADTGVHADTTHALLTAATDVLPALKAAKVMESWTGLRPKRGDGTPIIAALGEDEYVAAAHYRNGVLLAPATARMLADMIDGKPGTPDANAFALPGHIAVSP